MNDEELRAFLDSATVGDDDEQREDDAGNQPEPVAEPTVVLPPAPAAPGTAGRAPSFDELMGWGSPSDAANDADLAPIVLPGPKPASSGTPRQTPAAPPEPAAPVTPPAAPTSPPAASPPPAPWPVTPAPDPWAPVSAAAPPAAAAPTTPIVPITQTEPAVGPSTSAFPEASGDYEKIAVTGGDRGGKRFIPWIIVAVGAVIALIVAVFLIGSLNGGAAPEQTAAPTTAPGAPSEDTRPTTSGPEETRPTTEPRDPQTDVPQVEVGPIMNMPITQWGVQADLSQKLGDTFYNITGENLVLTSSLITSLPATCEKEWGMTRAADGTFHVLKPAERCAAAPELYDELWGLMDAMVKTVHPL